MAGRYQAAWKSKFGLPWREAGPSNHLDDKVDSDQWLVKKELSLWLACERAERMSSGCGASWVTCFFGLRSGVSGSGFRASGFGFRV